MSVFVVSVNVQLHFAALVTFLFFTSVSHNPSNFIHPSIFIHALSCSGSQGMRGDLEPVPAHAELISSNTDKEPQFECGMFS